MHNSTKMDKTRLFYDSPRKQTTKHLDSLPTNGRTALSSPSNRLPDDQIPRRSQHGEVSPLELRECLLDDPGALDDLDDIEADRLAEWSTLPHRHHITDVDVPAQPENL